MDVILKDRFIKGLIAGFLAGFVMDVLDLTGYYLKFDESRYLDFASIITFGHTARAWYEVVTALLVELAFKSVLGVMFVLLIPKIKSSYLIVKGIIFGSGAWFAIFGIITISHSTNMFPKVDFGVGLSHIINSSLYGLVLALTLLKMEQRVNIRTKKYTFVPVPARKHHHKERKVIKLGKSNQLKRDK